MTIFVDACLGTSIKPPLMEMGIDVVLHNDMFSPGTSDVDWMQTVAEKQWPVLTRDAHIKKRGIERQAVIDGSLKVFVLGSGKADLQTHISVVKNNLVSMVALFTHMPGPFFASLTKQDLKFQWLGEREELNA